jgi:hypothetical protein
MWHFVMDKSGAEAGFLRELRFSLPIYIPSSSPQSVNQDTDNSDRNMENEKRLSQFSTRTLK